jgi:hypothetical protein
MNEPTLIRYATPEEVFAHMWSGDDVNPDDLRDASFPMLRKDGSEVEMTHAEVIESLTRMGCWAHADVLNNAIHVWIGDAPVALVVEMIGHELGHLSDLGRDPRTLTAGDAEIDLAEERRADMFGDIAAMAYRLALGE